MAFIPVSGCRSCKLTGLPNKDIHVPWKTPDEDQQRAGYMIGKDHPEPILVLKATWKAALEIYNKQIRGK